MKFRLGGPVFPPKIYYKIFTRRPVIDMNAFSPRDYAAAPFVVNLIVNKHDSRLHPCLLRKTMPADKFNHPGALTRRVEDDMSGWYRRVENNGWRSISTSVCHIL